MVIKIFNHAINIIRNSLRDIGKGKRSPHWATVEKNFKKLNPNCAVCGSSKRIQVHHKKPFHLYPELELDANNLITVCMDTRECHLLIAHGDDFKYYSATIEDDAALLKKDISRFDEIAARAKKNRRKE